MKLVIYSVTLNLHQAPVANALWELTEHNFVFVELINTGESKGGTKDHSQCPYLLKAWEKRENYAKAMKLARTADCCIFSGVDSLPYQKERMKFGLLSFDMSERWLKRGIINLFSPAIFKMFIAYHLGRWNKKPLYKLCCSAFAATDQHKLATFRDKCYKWGYFTKVERFEVEASIDVSNIVPLMWCSRYLKLKHPELPILMAERLKRKGYSFRLDMYGSGEYESNTRQLAQDLDVTDVVRFYGNIPNDELLANMRRHSIFLFTSDRKEGWGAVANECLSNGCVLVASDAIGSVPYLLKDGINGFAFTAPKTTSSLDKHDRLALDSLCEKVEWLLNHPEERETMRQNAVKQMQSLWSPQTAAERLLKLIDCLRNKNKTPFTDGPCSIA